MAWTAPRTWVAGEVVTAAVGNSAWRDNFTYLKTQQDLDDTHRAASAAVHGLPASVNVLGNRSAAGEFVQRWTTAYTWNDSNNYYDPGAISFPIAFSGAPRVWGSLTVASLGRSYVASVYDITTTTVEPILACLVTGQNNSGNILFVALGA